MVNFLPHFISSWKRWCLILRGTSSDPEHSNCLFSPLFKNFFFLSHSVIAPWLIMGFTLPRNGSYLSVLLYSIINSSSWIFPAWQNVLRAFHPKSMQMALLSGQIPLKNIAFSIREKQTIKTLLYLKIKKKKKNLPERFSAKHSIFVSQALTLRDCIYDCVPPLGIWWQNTQAVSLCDYWRKNFEKPPESSDIYFRSFFIQTSWCACCN